MSSPNDPNDIARNVPTPPPLPQKAVMKEKPTETTLTRSFELPWGQDFQELQRGCYFAHVCVDSAPIECKFKEFPGILQEGMYFPSILDPNVNFLSQFQVPLVVSLHLACYLMPKSVRKISYYKESPTTSQSMEKCSLLPICTQFYVSIHITSLQVSKHRCTVAYLIQTTLYQNSN